MFDKPETAFYGIEVFRKRIPDDITALLEQATDDDLYAITDVKSETRRAEILATRSLIRSSFGESVSLAHNSDGSPRPVGSCLYISISHCRGMVTIAAHPTMNPGIDIERWRNTLLKVKSKYLSTEEMEHFRSPDELLAAWTAKEAVYKAAGCEGIDFANGINMPLSPIDNKAIVHLPEGDRQFYLFTSVSGEITMTIALPC